MKKIISFLLIFIIALSSVMVLSSCDTSDTTLNNNDADDSTNSNGNNSNNNNQNNNEDDCSYGHTPSENGYCVYCGVNAVEYISNRSIQHDDGYFTFIFSLLDEYECEIAVNAIVNMRIENEDGDIVYQATKEVTTDDYSTWSNNFGKEWYAASLRIYDSEIDLGTSTNGNFIFDVTVNGDCYFDEYSLSIYDELPKIDLAAQCTLKLPSLPNVITDNSLGNYMDIKVTEIDYYFEETYGGDIELVITITGQRVDKLTGSMFDDNTSYHCNIGYKLLDSDGYIVKSGEFWTPQLAPEEKFKNVSETFYGLEPGDYTLVLIDVV